ncbi:MAG: TCR/Tet family MFS transporter [Alphaproteobacteria bacterium]|nr:TCR/Tet family MFS transporter [Alphaproteobacteria bacterium]
MFAPRAAVAFVLVTVIVDMIALGMMVATLPILIIGLTGGDPPTAARIYGVIGTCWALMQFIGSPIMGALSDRFGRRPILLLSSLGRAIDYAAMALAPSVGWLFMGRMLSGFTSATIPSAGAYIADVAPPEKRAAAFGLIGASFGIGFSVGPALGGFLSSFDPRLPFWFCAAISLANVVYGYFVLPESLAVEKRAAFSWARANPLGSLKLLRSHPELFGLACVAFLHFLAHGVLPNVMVIYVNFRFGWTSEAIGYLMAVSGLAAVLVQGGLVRPLVKRFGERTMLMFGLGCGAIGFAIYGSAAIPPVLFCGIPFVALWGLASASSQGLLTRHVGPQEQGRLQGALACVRSITDLIGPFLFTLTFANFAAADAPLVMPGAAHYVSSLLLVGGAVLAWRVTRAPT